MCDYEKSELDIYLGEPSEDVSKDLDVLSYWKKKSASFSIVSSIARDVLAIPITSVASESTFSMGGRILCKERSSLISENVNALVTTKSWLTGYDGKILITIYNVMSLLLLYFYYFHLYRCTLSHYNV